MKRMKWAIASALVGASLLVTGSLAASADTLDNVKKKGFVQCGVNPGIFGFGSQDSAGVWTGLDIDVCRAVAAAVFGDATKVKYSPLDAKERFTALQSGEVDLLARNTTWTMSRDTSQGLMFVGVNYYDGQGFMVRKSLGITSAKDLEGAKVCTQTGTTTELNLADFFRAQKKTYEVVAFEKNEEVRQAYESGRCDAYTTDASGLYAERLKLQKPDDHVILPEIISKEPLGPAVRQGDDKWFGIVKWTLFAMINAEELGLTKSNIDAAKTSDNPEVKRFVGAEGDFGTSIGLTNDWAFNVIKTVGNYGESFDTNVGPNSKLGIARGLNNLWSKGGIIYAPPIR